MELFFCTWFYFLTSPSHVKKESKERNYLFKFKKLNRCYFDKMINGEYIG